MRSHLQSLAVIFAVAALTLGGCISSPSAPSRSPSQAPSASDGASTERAAGTAGAKAAPSATEAHASKTASPSSTAATGTSTAAPPPSADATQTADGDNFTKVASADARAWPQGAAGSALPAGAAKTSEERRAAIERKLDDSLGAFDAQIRKEQERVAKERDARQATGVTTTASDGTADPQGQGPLDNSGSAATEGPNQDARGNAGGRRSGSERRSNTHAGDLKSEKSTGAAGNQNDNAGNGATARQIPDGSDDDVVARRLRKAAEQETDPELKDKLWKEYIDYKNNAGK